MKIRIDTDDRLSLYLEECEDIVDATVDVPPRLVRQLHEAQDAVEKAERAVARHLTRTEQELPWYAKRLVVSLVKG